MSPSHTGGPSSGGSDSSEGKHLGNTCNFPGARERGWLKATRRRAVAGGRGTATGCRSQKQVSECPQTLLVVRGCSRRGRLPLRRGRRRNRVVSWLHSFCVQPRAGGRGFGGTCYWQAARHSKVALVLDEGNVID